MFALVAIPLVPLLALVIWYLLARTSNAAAVRKLENEARQRGEPLTLAELRAKYPPIPDEENAAAALLELWQSEDPVFWLAFENGERPLPKRDSEQFDPMLPYLGSDASRPSRAEPLSSNSLAAADSYLNAKAAHIEQVRAAIQRPHFRFAINIEDGPDTLLPHLPRVRSQAQDFRDRKSVV